MDWINDPKKWMENTPPPSIPSSFTDDLLRAGGTNAKGQPNFRIVWGQDFDKTKIWSREFEKEWFPRYWYRTVRRQRIIEHPAFMIAPVVFDLVKVGIPRFFIETRLDPAVYYASGTETSVDSDGVVTRAAQIDDEACWWTFLEICDHKDGCCAYSDSLNSNCHGVFTVPGGKHLDAVQAYRKWFDEIHCDPNKPVTADFKTRIYQQMRDAEQKNRETLMQEMEYATRHFVNTHFTQLSDDPSVRKHGRFHFLGK